MLAEQAERHIRETFLDDVAEEIILAIGDKAFAEGRQAALNDARNALNHLY